MDLCRLKSRKKMRDLEATINFHEYTLVLSIYNVISIEEPSTLLPASTKDQTEWWSLWRGDLKRSMHLWKSVRIPITLDNFPLTWNTLASSVNNHANYRFTCPTVPQRPILQLDWPTILINWQAEFLQSQSQTGEGTLRPTLPGKRSGALSLGTLIFGTFVFCPNQQLI